MEFSVQPVTEAFCSLFSQSYDSWPRIRWAIHLSPLPPHVLDSAKTPEWIDRTKKEDKFQIEKLMRMPRKCFITFKKTVKVSVKAHMILISFLCYSLSFFSSFSTNKLLNVWVKPHACVCLRVCMCVCVVPSLVQSELTSAGSGSISWQFALKSSVRERQTECFLAGRRTWLRLGRVKWGATHIILSHHSNTIATHTLSNTRGLTCEYDRA